VSWQGRDYSDDPWRRSGRPGGDWRGIRPTLDNPVSWSLPLGRWFGIAVRVHLIFLLFIVIELLGAAVTETTLIGFWLTGLTLTCLFGIVLLHEFGHCLACRRTGGQADEILMWPLGGLAFCRPPQRWMAHLVTAIGGPMVNVVICAVLVPTLGLLTGKWWQVAIPNPFNPVGLFSPQIDGWWLMALFLANWLSLIILLFNLLPIFPLDGGRIVQALLWPRLGYARSMRVAVWTGYFGALALLIAGFVMQNVMVVMIAVFGGIICYVTNRQLAYTEAFLGFESESVDYSASLAAEGRTDEREPAKPSRRERRAEQRMQREQAESQRVDRILEKIATSGLESLSTSEKRLLKRATQRQQQERQ
jgi:Zn-dependent protease